MIGQNAETVDFTDELADEALDRRDDPAVTGNTKWSSQADR